MLIIMMTIFIKTKCIKNILKKIRADFILWVRKALKRKEGNKICIGLAKTFFHLSSRKFT